MSKARNLQRGDIFTLQVPLKVLSVKALPGGLVKLKAEAVNSPSLEFADDGCMIEVICKARREFSSFPHRPDDRKGGAAATHLEPV